MDFDQFPPYPGLRPAAFRFMRELKKNNRREWFNERKQEYQDEVQWPLQCLVMDVSRRLAPSGVPLRADPRKSLFRIYRDTRFSNNKDPYKTAQGAVLTPSGDNKAPGGIYVHFKPGECFLAAGFWHPSPELLRAWRTRMFAHPESFLEAMHSLENSGLTLDSEDMLKRMPRGFENPPDDDLAPFLLYKSFVTVRSVTDEAMEEPAFADRMVEFAAQALPLLQFGWDAS